MTDFSEADVFGVPQTGPPVQPVAAAPLPNVPGYVSDPSYVPQPGAGPTEPFGQSPAVRLGGQQEYDDKDVFAGHAPADLTAGKQPDFGLGFYKGAMKPLDNMALGLDWLAHKTGAGAAIDDLGAAMGLPSASQAVSAHQAFIDRQPVRPGPLGTFAGELAGSLPATYGMGPLATGALTSAMLTDAKTPRGIAIDAATGAVGGKLLDGTLGAIKGAVAPQIGSQLRTLMDAKIPLTVGAMTNGATRRLEDGATSFPILGDIINGAKARSIMGLNRAVANRALGPVGEQLPNDIEAGRPAVAYVGDRLSQRYRDLLPGLTITADQPFVSDMQKLAQTPLQPDHANMLKDFVNNQVRPYVGANGAMSGQSMKDVEETIGAEIKDWKNSPLPADRKYAAALDDLRGSLRDLVARNNPAAGEELQNLNRGWANLAIMEDAASRQGAVDGIFTPSQLEAAVRKGNDTVRKRGFARGDALMQDLSDAAKARLPSTVPDSGSPLRHAIEAAVGLGVAKESGLLKPLIKGVAVGGTVGLPYTRVGQATLNKIAGAPRGPMSAELAKLLETLRPTAAAVGGVGAPLLAGPFVQQTGP